MNLTLTEERQNTSLGHVGHVLYLDPPEQVFPSHVAAHMQSISWAAMTMILTTNGYLIYFIFSKELTTFLDWLVIIESSLGFNQCFTVLVVGSRIRSLCLFSPFNAYFVGILNRLLNVGIVIYRCVFVLLW